MKPTLKEILEDMKHIPSKRLPLNKASWLQEWNDVVTKLEAFEKQLREFPIAIWLDNHHRDGNLWATHGANLSGTLVKFINEVLGDE